MISSTCVHCGDSNADLCVCGICYTDIQFTIEERNKMFDRIKELESLVDKLKYSDNRPICFDDKGAMDSE